MNAEQLHLLNRIGLLLDFLAFWLAAPEILGEERLKKAESLVERFIKAFPFVITIIIGLIVLVAYAYMGSVDVDNLFKTMQIDSPLEIRVYSALFCFTPILVAVLVPIIMVMLFATSQKLLTIMANDENIRKRALVIGAILFILGFILQFIAS
jgi:hypothetical protein